MNVIVNLACVSACVAGAIAVAVTDTSNPRTASTYQALTVEANAVNDVTTFNDHDADFLLTVTNLPELEEIEIQAEQPSYSEDDLFCLAAVIYRESGASSEEVKMLVGNVVLNRVASDLYPNTIREVLTQKKQYGLMWKNGVSFPTNASESLVADCYDIAKRLLDGERVCPENVLFQAEFKQGSGVYKQIGNIFFCYYG